MRILLMAAVSACVAGSAWADLPREAPADQSARVAGEVTRNLDAALEAVVRQLEALPIGDAEMREVRSAVELARTRIRLDLAAYDGRLDALSPAEEAALEARIEAAMVRVAAAVERASQAFEVTVEEGQH